MINRRSKGGGVFLGIEIGGTKLQITVGDAHAKILECIRFAVDRNAGAEGIRRQLEKSVPALARRVKPKGIGVGFGGPVDWRMGRICCSHQIQGWSNFPLADWLADLAGVLVAVENDANLGALGEALHGAGKDHTVIFYATLGSGVGGGLVNDGKIYHGALPGEVEIGHLRLNRAGTILEKRCSGWAIDVRLRAAARKNPRSSLARRMDQTVGGEARFLAAAIADGDRAATRILNEMAEDLAFGLSHVTHLLHPEIIVLGGGLSLVGEPLRAAVEGKLRGFIMEAFLPGPRVALSRLRANAVPVGALSLAAGGRIAS